ncbi:DNA cytosine methyltransferase [Alcanivorax sp.]|uniref:DNA cytosine methyltransferase n=1 Tax=Alcanivorax sp. TaxID=1872427 RepID=UPI003A956DDE
MSKNINVIDLFAGPGGLGEGFSAYKPEGKSSGGFRIRMSVEKEASAHKTLSLRALYRLLKGSGDVRHYHQYFAGHTDRAELIDRVSDAWEEANIESLGGPKALGEDNELIHKRLRELAKEKAGEPWVVIGGPPCQAYSLAGRSRNKGIKGYKPEADSRHFLYQEYLEVLSIIQPDVFVMENVKGILTSQVGGTRIFPSIRDDLKNPTKAVRGVRAHGKQYKIYSFVENPDASDGMGNSYSDDSDYIIRAENFGVPQARHRVILLGVCVDIDREPMLIQPQEPVHIETVLTGLPSLRSKLSKQEDSPEAWRQVINEQARSIIRELGNNGPKENLSKCIEEKVALLKFESPTVSKKRGRNPFSNAIPEELKSWLDCDPPEVLRNHESRGHMESDLGRYLFSACWAEAFSVADAPIPKSGDFPICLEPAHANWKSGHFADRFRVQRKGRPATTVTSHISKDGHYFIHYDPTQCRALTVREAARIQTFPDNYLFEGNRTQQYVQVGNAVPPFLAKQLAGIVFSLIG